MFIFTALGLTVGLLLTGLLLSNLYSQALTRNIDDIAIRQTDALIARLLVEDENAQQSLPSIDPRYTQANSGWYWQIVDSTGSISNVSTSAFGVVIPHLDIPFDEENKRRGNTIDEDGKRLRLFERKLFVEEQNQVTITVTADWDEVAGEVSSFQNQAFMALVVIGLFLASLCALVARLSLGPLLRLSSEVEDVRTGEHSRIIGDFPKEILPVKSEINALLDVNDKILDRAKNQVGDLAHGLKTPIAVIRNETENSNSKLVPQQLDKMQSIVSRYLDRAQLAARTAARGKKTDVVAAVSRIVSVMNKLHRDKHAKLIVEDGFAVSFLGDAEDFDELAGNIIDNAMKWASTRVEVHITKPSPSLLQIVVEDDGAGLSEQEKRAVFQRGRRLDEQVQGSGLGLGIVSELISVYGGEIELGTAKLGGLQVKMQLPATNRS
ncbi:sensor histidine kinase [Maritalea porphyrae]|uniref:sensor histidine kinase n=1 Tax=Maritalea porphyrae TaxID=880732 RepID=UPI0024E16E00|nr:sensor histidine kinase [Maritalea porphyrae]